MITFPQMTTKWNYSLWQNTPQDGHYKLFHLIVGIWSGHGHLLLFGFSQLLTDNNVAIFIIFSLALTNEFSRIIHSQTDGTMKGQQILVVTSPMSLSNPPCQLSQTP